LSYQILALRDISDDQRKHMPEEDFAGKGRSFPIEKPEDVHAAAASIGRAGDDNFAPDELKKNIKAIAKRKGAEFVAQLPEDWKAAMDDVEEMCDEPKAAMSDKGPRWFVRLGAVTDGLKRVPIAILGNFVKGAQKFSITRKTMADIVANFAKRPADTVIDYEHASEFPEAAKGQPIPASGWIKRLDDAPDGKGVLWGYADFTDRAKEMIGKKEYRYFSPVIDWGARDKHSGEPQGATLISGALTNRPFLEAMPALALSAAKRGTESKEEASVKVTSVVVLDDRKVKVTMDDGTEAVSAEAIPALKVVRLSDVKRDKDGKYDFSTLPHDGETLIAGDVLHGMQVQTELDAAVTAGKITPAQRGMYEKLALTDLAGFRGLVAGMKQQVALSEKGTAAEGLTGLAQVNAAIEAQVEAKRKARPKLGYGEALKLVASEQPELFAQKQKFQKGGR
jgi:phage I-like protein